MSNVTNVILSMDVLDEDEGKQKLQEVNAFFEELQRGFVSVDDEDLPEGWYGGSKMLEADLAIGAFNHLQLDKLVEHIKTIKWAFPENVQLIVKGQDDDRFRIISVFDNVPRIVDSSSTIMDLLHPCE